MIFQYNNIPVALLPILKDRIESCAEFFPGWVQTVVVEYETLQNADYEIMCNSEYKYRFVVFTVSEEFFRSSNWKETVLHEIMHAIAAPLTTQIWAAAEIIVEDSAIRKYIETQLKEAEEAFATDSAALLDKVLQSKISIDKKHEIVV